MGKYLDGYSSRDSINAVPAEWKTSQWINHLKKNIWTEKMRMIYIFLLHPDSAVRNK